MLRASFRISSFYTFKLLFPRISKWAQIIILSERALSFLSPKKEDVGICAVLKKLQSSCCLLTFTPKLLKRVLPGLYRTIRFYSAIVPILGGYLQTLLLETKNKYKSAEQLQLTWDERHSWGAQRAANMLKDLSGFYIKVGQVFATKTDLLPRQYIEALKFVFEDCPATSFKKVKKLLRTQLGISISTTFINFNCHPIASATIAQVHTGVLKGSNDQVAVKVQHAGSENLMRSDIRNMLAISKMMDRVGLKPPIDHTSVLIEYAQQVPKEFDFRRESDMLNSIGSYLSEINIYAEAPQSFPFLSSTKILTMTFIDGLNCSDSALFRQCDELNISDGKESASAFCKNLISSYGFQLFGVGIFHSDPHPGNVLLTSQGKCALIDFGQMKVLRDEIRLVLARLVIALYSNSKECIRCMRQLGLKLENTTIEVDVVLAYLLFDTRMDIKEAHLSPLDFDLPPELRVISLSEIDSDVFMIIRIISMFRGIFLSHSVDVHARKIWYPLALSVLYQNGEYSFRSEIEVFEQSVRSQMEQLSSWMKDHDLPSDQAALMPFAISKLYSASSIRDAIKAKDTVRLNSAFKKFSTSQKERCIQLVQI